MAITVVQATEFSGAWSGSFGAAVTAGNTVFLVPYCYGNASMSSGSPTVGGSAVTGATLLGSGISPSSFVYAGVWMLPNVQTASAAVALTNTGSGTIDNNVGMAAYEVSGLGTSPALDQGGGTFATGNSTNPASGTTGAITSAPEFVIACAVAFGNAETKAGGAWTEQFVGTSSFCLAGYQIPTSSGGTYAYNVTAAAGTWTDGISTVKTGSTAVAIPLGPSRRVAYRVQGLPPQRRYRQTLPVPAQLNPPYPFAEIVQRRQPWPRGMPKRSHVTFVVPKQLNPPYPFSEIRQWRQLRGMLPRRGHQVMPVPAQQAAAPNPAITFQARRTRQVMPPRRGHVSNVTPPQAAAPAGVFVPQAQRHARIMGAGRRGKITAAHLGQHEPPRQRQPGRPRPVIIRKRRPGEVVPAQVVVAAPAWVQGHRSPLRAITMWGRRFRQLLPWPQAVAPPFSIGALTASAQPYATLTASTAGGGSSGGSLTATDQRTGGPS